MTAHEFYLHAAGYKEPDVVIVKGKIQKEHLRLFVQPACNRCVFARQLAHIMYARAILDQTYHANSKICVCIQAQIFCHTLSFAYPFSPSLGLCLFRALPLSLMRAVSLACPACPPSLSPSLTRCPPFSPSLSRFCTHTQFFTTACCVVLPK